MKKIFFHILILKTLLSITIFVNAQSDTIVKYLEILTLNDIIFQKDTSEIEIITAGKTAKSLSELPFTIHFVTHEEIIRNNWISLIDVLKSMPGIRTSSPGSGEMGNYFEIRGFPGNFYAVILINGIPVKPSGVKGMPLGSQLPVRQAERIEIIYGPSASVYGNDAVVGVINIITKNVEQRNFVRADVSLGNYEYNYFNFTIGGKAGKNKNILKFVFSANKEEFKDLPIKYNIDKFYNPLNSFFDSINFNGKTYLSYQLEKTLNDNEKKQFILEKYGPNYEGTISTPLVEKFPGTSYMTGIDLDFRGFKYSYYNMYRRLHSSIGHSTMKYRYNNPQNFWGENIHVNNISYNKIWPKFSTNTQFTFLTYKMDNNSSIGLTYINNGDRIYRYSASNDLIFEQIFNAAISGSTELVAGFSVQKSAYLPLTGYLSTPFNEEKYIPFSSINVVDTNFIPIGIKSGTFSNYSSFIQMYIKQKNFRFIIGTRGDFHTRYGLNINPRIAILYRINRNNSLRLSAGFAYKTSTPSMEFEIKGFKIEDKYFYEVAPLHDLKPELFQSYEVGFNTLISKSNINISFFYNQVFNQFAYKKVSSNEFKYLKNVYNDSILTIKNSDGFSRIYGIQIQIIRRNLIQAIKLNAILNLMFNYTTKDLPQIETILENIKLMPRHYGNLQLEMTPFKNIYLRIENIWETKWLRNLIVFEKLYSEMFKNTDGFLCTDILLSTLLSENLRFFIKINNIFNEKYNGMNTTGLKEDKLFNPQPSRNIKFGLSFTLN